MFVKRIGFFLLITALLALQGLLLLMWLWGVVPYRPLWLGGVAVADALLLAWAVYGWWQTRQWYWPWLAVLFAATAGSGALWALDYHGSAVVVVGVGCMWLSFFLGHALIRAALSQGVAWAGVARTLIDEAIRMKLVLVMLVGLLLIVPALPFMLDPKELLRYRIQFFLTWSLSSAAVLLSVMTVALSCATVCGDLSRKQVYLSLTKPLGRGQYLLGKWVGVMLLNLLLVLVTGVGVYVFAKVMQMQPHRDPHDRAAIDNQVFVARRSQPASPPPGLDLNAVFETRLTQLQADDPDRYAPDNLTAGDRLAIRRMVEARWHTIPPLGSQRYLFTDVGRAKAFGQWVQLRFKPVSSATPPDQRVRLAMWLNGRPYPTDPNTGRQKPIVVADSKYYIVDLPVSMIDTDGRLEVRIDNVDLDNPRATFASSVSFAPGQGLEVLYQVGRFEPNLARALIMIWMRLGFLAMLGLAAGSVLEFPVACLLCGLVYAAAGAHEFFLESMQLYVPVPGRDRTPWDALQWLVQAFFERLMAGQVWEAVKVVIRLVGNGFVLLIPSFSHYNPVPLVADGRVVAGRTLASAALWVGLVSTGGCAAVGWVMLRARELARVTV